VRINQFYNGSDLVLVLEYGSTKAVFSRGGNQVDLLADVIGRPDGSTTASWIRTGLGQKEEGSIQAGADDSLVEGFVDFCPECLQAELRRVLGIGQEPEAIAPKRTASVADIIDRVSDYYNLSPKDLTGRKRTKEIALARHVAIYLASRLTIGSSTNIGRRFGRDHSSVIYANKSIEDRITTERSEAADSLRRAVRSLLGEFMPKEASE